MFVKETERCVLTHKSDMFWILLESFRYCIQFIDISRIPVTCVCCNSPLSQRKRHKFTPLKTQRQEAKH